MATALWFLVVLLVAGARVEVAAANSYWQRMGEGFPNSILVHEYVYEYRGPELEITARIPQLAGVDSALWQAEFNESMHHHLEAYVAELKDVAAEVLGFDEEHPRFPYEGIMDFEVKLNRGGLLSIAIVNYSYTGGAHGMTYYDYINVDLTVGHHISFHELLDSEAELNRAAEIVNAKISEQPDHFFVDSFTPSEFHEEQGFYLQDTGAVICFGLYELAPYAYGISEFAVPAP
ncbi:MAG: DUF3298 and DUF4163 domain-containing protein [Limnochordia bacterium]|nr:DUF3298 and DUF4163 domain-containing protein [Limnochordia bacterium]